MKCLHAILEIWICLLASGCHPFWNPAGARTITYKEFDTIYYQTSADRTKAYLFFSQPKGLIVGMSLSTTGYKYGVGFGAVSDTASHRRRYGRISLSGAMPINNLWMLPFDIGDGNGKPSEEFRMFYGTEDDPWGIPIPCRGTRRD